MQRKWLVASVLFLAELAVLGGIIVASRNGLSWQSVFGLRFGDFASISAQSDDNQSFSVSGPAALDLSDQTGAITVTGGSGSQIMVQAHKAAWGADQAGAATALAALKVTMTQVGNVVTIKVEQPAEFPVVGAGRGPTVDFTIEVPAATAVRAHTGFGDVQLAATTGDIDLASSSGRVSAHDVTGRAQLQSDFGDVSLQNATASSVLAHSSSGKVDLTQVQASGSVVLQNDFGDVSFVGGRAASLDARTSSGDVTLIRLTVDGQAAAHSDFGAVTLAQVTAGGGYDVGSSSGDVSLDGATGSVKARTDFGQVKVVNATGATLTLHSSSGAVSFAGSLGAGPHSLTTDFGDVRLSLPPATAANLDLTTSFGNISSALPVSVSGILDKQHWIGKLNGGGPELKVATSNGTITLETLK